MKTTENLLKNIWQQGRHLERKLMRQKKISAKAEKFQIKQPSSKYKTSQLKQARPEIDLAMSP